MPPAQAGEAGVVTVGRNPFAARLDRERGEVGVGHEVALCPYLTAKPRENGPVTRAGRHDNAARLRQKRLSELEGVLDGGGGVERLWVGDDPQKAA